MEALEGDQARCCWGRELERREHGGPRGSAPPRGGTEAMWPMHPRGIIAGASPTPGGGSSNQPQALPTPRLCSGGAQAARARPRESC